MSEITPFLWFDDQAEQAAKFYVSVFKGKSKLDKLVRYGELGPGKPGSVMTAAFRLRGKPFVALNGGPYYQMTPAISFVVTCKTQREIDGLWKKLSQGGQELQCGWLTDKFGVTWQIVPVHLEKLLAAPAAMAAMMKMKKLEIATLKAAAKAKKA